MLFHSEEKSMLPKEGPDGGDGGRGGAVFLEANPSYVNLSHLFKDRIYKAENGQPGQGQKKIRP